MEPGPPKTAAVDRVGGSGPSPSVGWAEVLAHGVDGWSSFSETDSHPDDDSKAPEEAGPAAESARRAAGNGAHAEANETRPGDGAAEEEAGRAMNASGDVKGVPARASGGGGGGAAQSKSGGGAATGGGKEQREGKRAALDAGWKQYRRDVEWQCSWLELRMKEVSGHVHRYERMLEGIERAKKRAAEELEAEASADPTTPAHPAENQPTNHAAAAAATAAASSDQDAAPPRERRMKRRRQQKTSDDRAPHPGPVLAAHPLFAPTAACVAGSGAGHTKPSKAAPGADAAHGKAARPPPAPPAVKQKRRANGAASGASSGSDSDLSTAALYEQIEALQQRVEALHRRLGQPAPAPIVAVVKAKPAGVARGGATGPAGHGGRDKDGAPPAIVQRHNSRKDDFDINNVLGAVPTGAKYVERARHVDICTPSVRAAATYAMAPVMAARGTTAAEAAVGAAITAGEGGNAVAPDGRLADGGGEADTSSEDTSDEAFLRRHLKLEAAERAARTLPDKKSSGRGSGDKGGGDKGAGKVAAAAAAGSGGDGGSWDSASGLRRKGGSDPGSRSKSPPSGGAMTAGGRRLAGEQPAVGTAPADGSFREDGGRPQWTTEGERNSVPELNSAALVG